MVLLRLKKKLIKLSELINFTYPRSYSQEGEDLILRELFLKKKNGTFIDVGAHHPKRFSNTYFFYRRGWRGINIDAYPGSMRLFNIFRRRDINIESGVGAETCELNFYVFNEPAISTFSPESAEKSQKNYKLLEIKKIAIEPLSNILEKYLPANNSIDIMSIDVEGFDYDVLISNNWTKCVPKIILVEVDNFDIGNNDNKTYNLLISKGYSFHAKTPRTLIMKHKDF